MKGNIVQEFEKNEVAKAKKMADFSVGDTIVVKIKIKEEGKERIQSYEGVVIAIKNRGFNSSFTVRKISHGEGVERVFQTYSPMIHEVVLKRRGEVRKAKLYHMRGLYGKKARIKEKIDLKEDKDAKC